MHDRLHQFGRTQKRQFASTYYAPSSGDHFPQLGSEASAFPPPLLNQEVLLAMDFIGWHATTSRTSAKRTRLKFDAGTISPALGDCYTQTFLTARAILPHELSGTHARGSNTSWVCPVPSTLRGIAHSRGRGSVCARHASFPAGCNWMLS